MPITNEHLGDLILVLEEVNDPRVARRKLYPLSEILFLVINAVVCGNNKWDDIHDFGVMKLDWLSIHYPYSNGIPSHDTLNRVMCLINPRAFEKLFVEWVNRHLKLPPGTVINIDGKSLRGSATAKQKQTSHAKGGKSAVHVVEAWCGEFAICLCQYKTENKSNEITAIPEVLDMLDIEGATITIDAMGTQKAIARKIIDKGADYVLGVKDNQPALASAIENAFSIMDEANEPVDIQSDKGHGRIEERVCHVLPAEKLPKEFLDKEQNGWAGVKGIVRIKSTRRVSDSTDIQKEVRYYITSLGPVPALLNKLVREHWGIENSLHWKLDVVMGEDASKKRTGNVAENLALVNRIVLNLLNAYPENISLRRKINKCSLSDSYREEVLRF